MTLVTDAKTRSQGSRQKKTEPMKHNLTAEDMLVIWGLRTSGGSFTNPYKPSEGGTVGFDDERYIALYVELVPGFHSAREALRWEYILGRRPSEFPLRRPGEDYGRSLIRRGWGMHLGKAPAAVCAAVVREFREALEAQIRERPITFPDPVDESDAEAITAEVESAVEGRSKQVITW